MPNSSDYKPRPTSPAVPMPFDETYVNVGSDTQGSELGAN
jgi:hypothetical protein